MTITMDRNWVSSLKLSLPDYAINLGEQIEVAMTDTVLDPVEAQACALGAALADRNGELAFEISMSKVLFGNDIRTDIAKAVVDLMIDSPVAPNNLKLYHLTIACVLNQTVLASRIVDKLDEEGIKTDKIVAAQRIATLIPAISRCLI